MPFTASLPLNLLDHSGLPNAILAPFIRDPTLITSTSYAITGERCFWLRRMNLVTRKGHSLSALTVAACAGNSTLDSDTYNLIEGGYVLYPLEDLQLSPAVGTIPGFSFVNVSILQWVGKITQATFRIKST